MLHRRLSLFSFCTLLVSLIQPAAVAQSVSMSPLVGSWDFMARPSSSLNTTTVSGLLTFTSDGTVVESDTGEAAVHATPGHGIWQPSPVAGHWFVRFSSLTPNAVGSLHSRRIVTLTVAVNSAGDQFSGSYSFEVVDPTGHVLTTVTGTLSGQLMQHPLLP